MPLLPLKEILDTARANHQGVGMFNVVGLEYADAIINAAEDLNQPVIMGLPAPFLEWRRHSEDLVNMMIRMAERTKSPVAVHLDHGGYDAALRAIQMGFSSIMFDGSSLSFEENVSLTSEIVKAAHSAGISVEGELGYMGFAEGAEIQTENLTKPEEAGEFVRNTGVDALAVAIGNMHGHYKGVPCLDLNRLREIRASTACALVLHGGSGLSHLDFQNAVLAGISKINIFTSMLDVTARCVSQGILNGKPWHIISREMTEEVWICVKELMCVFARI
ncbi:MAG: class II fructose-bisphosphate aldolase [Clostridiales bacterium]|jgi:fructose-bisphosphate aldolase class II|nr:class II fructose-bisphosphate aldolase [Clostridiales bacterium]